ncbi:uncharacterized protein LOC126833036 [Adelges cooleyi]|uniref:uncharacterized protein LOC126833036 n=1 Tax=Adelges cooleyi TaxID=133065 RepID=UPI00217FF38B|nr:uncharacterized protein LOC126833036 [Adelges cooleyi]
MKKKKIKILAYHFKFNTFSVQMVNRFNMKTTRDDDSESSNLTAPNFIEDKNIVGKPNIPINRTKDGLEIYGRNVPRVLGFDGVKIVFDPKGGIIVNGERKEGFEDIKENGYIFLPYLVELAGFGCSETTQDNQSQTSTDNVNDPRNIVCPEGSQEESLCENFQSAGVGGSGKTQETTRDDDSESSNLTAPNFIEDKNIVGKPNIPINRTKDGLEIYGRNVPRVLGFDGVKIVFDPKGGIIVNGERKEGFEDIKENGYIFLPYLVELAGFGCSETTQDNQSQTSTDNVNDPRNIVCPEGSQEESLCENFQSAGVGGNGKTQVEEGIIPVKDPVVDMPGDNTIDGIKTGPTVEK